MADAPQINWLDKLTDLGWQTILVIGGAAVGWLFYIERKIGWVDKRSASAIAALALSISDNYVKKTDVSALEQRLAAEFENVKGSQDKIIDLLLQQEIGASRRR